MSMRIGRLDGYRKYGLLGIQNLHSSQLITYLGLVTKVEGLSSIQYLQREVGLPRNGPKQMSKVHQMRKRRLKVEVSKYQGTKRAMMFLANI